MVPYLYLCMFLIKICSTKNILLNCKVYKKQLRIFLQSKNIRKTNSIRKVKIKNATKKDTITGGLVKHKSLGYLNRNLQQ